MPTVRIFGQDVERKHLLIGGGLLAAAVAVIVFLRARAGAAAAQSAPAPQPEDMGYSGGMSVGAPSGQIADAYQQQMQNSELEASAIANKYQSNLVAQQQKQFDFQQRMQELLAPELLANEQAHLKVDTQYQKRVAKTRVACPGHQGVAKDPEGNLYCREKTSGVPIVTDLLRTAEGAVYGARLAAPEIGYEASKSAAAYYTGKYFTPTGVKQPKKQPVATPPIAPDNHGYGDYI